MLFANNISSDDENLNDILYESDIECSDNIYLPQWWYEDDKYYLESVLNIYYDKVGIKKEFRGILHNFIGQIEHRLSLIELMLSLNPNNIHTYDIISIYTLLNDFKNIPTKIDEIHVITEWDYNDGIPISIKKCSDEYPIYDNNIFINCYPSPSTLHSLLFKYELSNEKKEIAYH